MVIGYGVIGCFPGISSVRKFLTTKFKWCGVFSLRSPCVDFNIMRCTNSQGGRPTSSGRCVGQQGRPPCACRGTLVTPSLSLCPSLFPAIHTYLTQYWSLCRDHGLDYALHNNNNNYYYYCYYYNTCTWGVRATYGVSYVWFSSASCCLRKGLGSEK